MSEHLPHQRPYPTENAIAIRLLGSFELLIDGQETVLLSGKVLALFAYLLLNGRQSRTALTDTLWAATAIERRNSRLSDTVYRLRRALSGRYLTTTENFIQLEFPTEPWIDIHAFTAVSQRDDIPSLMEANQLYGGDLLAESDEEWLLGRRVTLQDQYFSCLLKLGEATENSGDLAAAAGHYRKLIELNPLFESGYRGLMRVQAGSGQIARALDTFATLSRILKEELDVAPSRESTMLASTLSRDLESSHAPPTFVGRLAERGQLLRALERAGEGQGGLALLLGEAGMGKSRLLEEIERAASWRRWRVQWGVARDLTLPAPYSPLADALQQALPTARRQQLAQQLPKTTLQAFTPIIPAMGDIEQSTPDKKTVGPAAASVMRALGNLLPHLFLLDDVQWADPEIWPVLSSLQQLLADANVLIIVSGRIDELQANDLAWSTIQAWDTIGVPLIRLAGLSTSELKQLAPTSLSDAVLSQIREASGGNPLLALTLLAEETTPTNGQGMAIENVLRRRLGRLSDPAGFALQLASVLGVEIRYETWSDLQNIVPSAAFPEVASELERAGLLLLTDKGYRFAHDTLRALVYRDAPVERRRRFHEQICHWLQAHDNPDILSQLHHAKQAALTEQLGPLGVAAGELMLQRLAYRSAIEHFSLALDNLPEQDLDRRYQALKGKVRAEMLLSLREQQGEDSAKLLQLASTIEEPRKMAEAYQLHAHYLWMAGDQDKAMAMATQGLAIAREHGETKCEADLLQITARVARNQGNYEETYRDMELAHELYKRVGHADGTAQTLDKLANLAYEKGEFDIAIARHEAAAQQFAELGDRMHEARTLNGLALAIRAKGDFESAIEIHQTLIRHSQELGDKDLMWIQQTNLGNIAFEMSNYELAGQWYSEALSLLRQIEYPYGEGLVLINLAESKLQSEKFAEARIFYEEALALNTARGFERGIGNAHEGIGLCYFGEGELDLARPQLEKACHLWLKLEQHKKLNYTAAVLARTLLALGELEGAEEWLTYALDRLDQQSRDTIKWRTIHFAAYEIYRAKGMEHDARQHLAQAALALEKLMHAQPREEAERLLANSFLNRQLYEEVSSYAETRDVVLARQNAPRGRALLPEEQCTVVWTIRSIADELISNSAERRRSIILRLLREAESQGGAPTDADIASALGVSRRTVIRDMTTLQEQGAPLPQRR